MKKFVAKLGEKIGRPRSAMAVGILYGWSLS
jgi:hypothetical protein